MRKSFKKIRLYKDGDSFGIETWCSNEKDFIDAFSYVFEKLIDENRFEEDWNFQIQGLLREFLNICAYYRGYSKTVTVTSLLGSGNVERINIIEEL